MQKTYKRIAEGIKILGDELKAYGVEMPIGFDGAIICHLLENKYCSIMNKGVVQISSRFNECDVEGFEEILNSSSGTIYALDLRTKTGSLGRILKQMKENWEKKFSKKVDLKYVVLFDPGKHADIRAFEEDLLDEERLLFLPNIEDLKKYIWQKNEKWHYSLSREVIKGFPHIQDIMELI